MYFEYNGLIQIIKKINKFLGGLFIFFLIIFTICSFSPSPGSYINYPGMLVGILFTSLWTVFGTCFWPNVAADSEGLEVEFIGKPLRVNWDKVINIHRVSFFGWPTQQIRPTSWLVTTKALTPLHRIFSFMFGGSFLPGFLLNDQLGNHELLLRLIRDPGSRNDL